MSIESTQFPWLGLFLIASIVSLFFQLVPSAWSSVLGALTSAWWTIWAIIDVRQWTWRSYAVLFAIAIAVLLVAKGRADNSG